MQRPHLGRNSATTRNAALPLATRNTFCTRTTAQRGARHPWGRLATHRIAVVSTPTRRTPPTNWRKTDTTDSPPLAERVINTNAQGCEPRQGAKVPWRREHSVSYWMCGRATTPCNAMFLIAPPRSQDGAPRPPHRRTKTTEIAKRQGAVKTTRGTQDTAAHDQRISPGAQVDKILRDAARGS